MKLTKLSCWLGFHHARWQPTDGGSRETWLKILTCDRCGLPLPRSQA